MEEQERIFTLDEAQRLIPRLRAILEDVGEEWKRMRDLNPEIQKVRDQVPNDAFTPHGTEYVEAVSHLLFLLHQIRDIGVVLKDVEKGLCDFPYMRQGRIVYLCWHLGEDAIGYWHDINSGFASRSPLDETDK